MGLWETDGLWCRQSDRLGRGLCWVMDGRRFAGVKLGNCYGRLLKLIKVGVDFFNHVIASQKTCTRCSK